MALVALLAAPAATVATVVAAPDVVEAARPRSSSEEVAASAARALDALDAWSAEGDPTRYVEYLSVRDETAEQAAAELGVDADDLVLAWSAAPPTKQVALLGALTQLGVPYRTRASEEGVGFDCSGLTTYAWGRAGVQLTRSSGDQVREAAEVDRDDADAGDLVYYPGHVMMYLGVTDAVIHSPNSGNHVEITIVSERAAARVIYADPLA
ncbi:MAG: NlpC/P60 family protein [Ilumatobacteraceae bacterium]